MALEYAKRICSKEITLILTLAQTISLNLTLALENRYTIRSAAPPRKLYHTSFCLMHVYCRFNRPVSWSVTCSGN